MGPQSFSIITTILVGGLLLHNLPVSNGYKILGLCTTHSPSHLIVHTSIMKSLAEAGHNITVVSTQKPKVTHPSIRHVIIPLSQEQEEQIHSGMNQIAKIGKSTMKMILVTYTSMSTLISSQFDVLHDERFTALYNEKFDLVLIGFFMNDFQIKVAAKFKCPVILNWGGAPFGIVDELVGNPVKAAYVPSAFVAVKTGEHMGFLKRVQNIFSFGLSNIFKFILDLTMGHFYEKLFPNEKDYPTLEEMRKNISLIFFNSHFSEGPIRPNVPAVVEIGGIQIKAKPDPLPKDIAEFLNTTKEDGFILFSLGSNLQGSNINPKVVETIFKTLASLKQKVIWKWEDPDNTPGKSTNILYKKWLPQDDILAHPNIKLFITHAGKGGIAEAQYHGVPMVALPVFAEQPGNAAKIELAGYGVQLDMLTMTEKEFKNAILEVLQNPKYKENIKSFSKLYRDRPQTAQETVVYWTEYVIRHHGAKHLQSPLIHLNFFQSTSLDVIGFLVLVVFIVFKVVKITFRAICKKFKSKKHPVNDKKLKKK